MNKLEFILNDALNKALCQKGRIQNPNSNTIAEFVSKYLQTKETLSFDVWFDINVVKSKDGKYFVDGKRLRFYELVKRHKEECLLKL